LGKPAVPANLAPQLEQNEFSSRLLVRVFDHPESLQPADDRSLVVPKGRCLDSDRERPLGPVQDVDSIIQDLFALDHGMADRAPGAAVLSPEHVGAPFADDSGPWIARDFLCLLVEVRDHAVGIDRKDTLRDVFQDL